MRDRNRDRGRSRDSDRNRDRDEGRARDKIIRVLFWGYGGHFCVGKTMAFYTNRA